MSLLWGDTAHTQSQSTDALNFFKAYSFTGGVVVKSVDLQPAEEGSTFSTGEIEVNEVPAGADMLFAFLYFETVTAGPQTQLPEGTQFRGFEIRDIAKPLSSPLPLNPVTAPCWGPTTPTYYATTWRTDVLRFFEVPGTVQDGSVIPTGKRQANGSHEVRLQESSGNQVPSTAGATVVIGYRMKGDPLRTFVMYDGLHVKLTTDAATTQNVRGFYDATGTADATLWYVAGTGQPNSSDRITFNPQSTNTVLGVNELKGSSPSSDRSWSSPDFDVTGLMSSAWTDGNHPEYGQQVTVALTHGSATPYDCAITTGIFLSMETPDRDEDGHPDFLEESTLTFVDPDGRRLPNLKAMAADPDVKDVFYHVDFLTAAAGTTYGPRINNQCVDPVCVTDPTGHSHRPPYESIKMLGDMFKNSPVTGSDGTIKGVRVHVDIGNHYQGQEYVVPFTRPNGDACTSTLDPECLAQGGEAIVEPVCVPNATNNFTCRFPYNPGTFGWKRSVQDVRDQPLVYPTPLEGETVAEACVRGGPACLRRLEPGRLNYIRYSLFGHGLGLQKFKEDDPATPYDDRQIPVTFSGIGDYPGGDMYMALGAFEGFTGTPLQIAATWAHETGHTMWRKHYGSLPAPGAPPELNCKPNYQTVMNYVYQLSGVATATGQRTIDFSREVLPGLLEGSLVESQGLAGANASWRYRTRFYAASNFPNSVVATPATRHCDGTPLNPGELGLYRVEATTVMSPPGNDWNVDGDWADTIAGQDVNFNGDQFSVMTPGSDDWSNLDFRQVGSRRNAGSPSGFGAEFGSKLSLNTGDGDIGDGDIGDGDIGDGDIGDGDIGDGDIGDGDIGDGDIGDGQEELSADTARAAQHISLAPTALTGASERRGIRLNWFAPSASKPPSPERVQEYRIYRVDGTAFTPQNFNPNNPPPPLATVPGTTTMYLDTSAKNNKTYTYGVVAKYASGTVSDFSNFVTVLKLP